MYIFLSIIIYQEIEVPVFIQYQGYPPHIDDEYKGRLRLIEQASVEISQIRITDEGWLVQNSYYNYLMNIRELF